MPKYLYEAHYTPDGAKGIIKEGGSARKAAIEQAVTAFGGRVETFYFAFGGVDAYVIVDLPDKLTPEETDAATKKSVPYRGPGR